jgi:chromate reductase
MRKKVGIIVGSLRKGAYTRMMARAVEELAPGSFALTQIGIGELPLYNQDLETDTPPAAWKTFRDAVRATDAILFITPEYNRGLPGAVKNAIDVGSRPRAQSVWENRPSAVISLTPGALGAMAANIQLRVAMSVLSSPLMPNPEAYIGNAKALFDDAGALTKADTRDYVQKYLARFEAWIDRLG